MKLTALLSWWDEPPELLTQLVLSLRGVASHLVALDGSYALWPTPGVYSGHDQWAALQDAARHACINLDLDMPSIPWPTETIKRHTLVQRGLITNPDWVLVIDGDEAVDDLDDHRYLHNALLHLDQAHSRRIDHALVGHSQGAPSLRLLRAQRGLGITGPHNGWVVHRNGHTRHLREDDAYNLSSLIRLDEARQRRPAERLKDAARYRHNLRQAGGEPPPNP